MNKQKTTLYINTSDNQKTVVGIFKEGNKKYHEEKMTQLSSQTLLPLIEKSLQEEGLALNHIYSIEVHPGPGSFTGVRVGVAIANALGWSLKVPVNGKKIELPIYEKSKFD